MSIHIHDVLDYLDEQRVCQKADSMESLLGTIYEAYERYSCFETEETREGLRRIHDLLEGLPLRSCDDVLNSMFSLCQSQEKLAFSQGVLAGMILMTEVNSLP